MGTLWDQVKERLSATLSSDAYQNWIAQTELESHRDGLLRIRVPDETTKAWIQQEYTAQIRRALDELEIPVQRLEYSVGLAAAASSGASFQRAFAGSDGPVYSSGNGYPNPEPMFENSASWLNPRLTFDSYVVGSCNQLAHAAAMAVSKMPSRSYNPLFIYGTTGIGKTHLMHAVGRSLLENFRSMNVVYTSSERFMNELVACLKTSRMTQFHRHYRSADVLLMDDIHILGGRSVCRKNSSTPSTSFTSTENKL